MHHDPPSSPAFRSPNIDRTNSSASESEMELNAPINDSTSSTSSDEGDFITVGAKRTRKGQGLPPPKTQRANVSTDAHSPKPSTSQVPPTPSHSGSQLTPARPKGTPPVIIQDKKAWTTISSALRDKSINFTRSHTVYHGIQVHVPTPADHRKLTSFLRVRNVDFHSFPLEEEKRLRVVIRDIPKEIEISFILEDLKSQSLSVQEVHRSHIVLNWPNGHKTDKGFLVGRRPFPVWGVDSSVRNPDCLKRSRGLPARGKNKKKYSKEPSIYFTESLTTRISINKRYFSNHMNTNLHKTNSLPMYLHTSIHEYPKEAVSLRILAPQYVCPKQEDDIIEKPDNTVITLHSTSSETLRVQWLVRWKPLKSPTQRFTIMLWRAVRELEKKLNGPQVEPNVYFIDNNDLLGGVDYIFNISEIKPNGDLELPKSFNIDNTQGDQKLTIEGRTDKFSLMLVGAQVAYVDVEFTLEALVMACYPTQDYYFVWTIINEVNDILNVSYIKGSTLRIPQYSLKAGSFYDVYCQLYKNNDGSFITQSSLPFHVHHRGIEVYLCVDNVITTVDTEFSIEAIVINHDNYYSLSQQWICVHEEELCDYFENIGNNSISFPSGFRKIGQYVITLLVDGAQDSISANATLTVIETILPTLQISPLPRLLNEGSTVTITATAGNVSPTCTLGFYFASEEYLNDTYSVINDTCENCQHGEELSESITINSLEENFLNELTDFTNDTEWRQVSVEMVSKSGRLRFLADCGCSLTYGCAREGTVYADINFQLNEGPKVRDVMVSPNSGTALETVFRISTVAAADPHGPLRYSFYCGLGNNDSLLLGSYIEHLAVETLLPYVGDGTTVWVKVCDSLGACSNSEAKLLHQSKGTGRTISTLIKDVRAHVDRCEMLSLRRVAVSAIETYNNTARSDLLSNFTTSLLEALTHMDENLCIANNYDQYSALLHWLNGAGVDITSLF
ncbi:uncharacterized protein ACR2FA_009445 [Aphomia sociella]